MADVGNVVQGGECELWIYGGLCEDNFVSFVCKMKRMVGNQVCEI